MPSSFDHYTLLTLVLTVLVAGVAGLARGFSGFGAALIFMPAGSALVGPAVAAPVLLVASAIRARRGGRRGPLTLQTKSAVDVTRASATV